MKDQVAVVTGGTSGIGFSIAQALASKGAFVYAVSRNKGQLQNKLDTLDNSVRKRIEAISTDVRDAKAVQDTLSYVCRKFGKIDILVNSAGVSMRENQFTEEVAFEEWTQIIETNLSGTFYMCKEVLPYMKQRNSGMIINILSTASYRAMGGVNVYSASKYGARALTEAMIEENKGSGVKITSVSPGPVATDIWSKKTRHVSVQEKAKMLKAEEITDIVLFLINRPENVRIDNITVQPRYF